MIIAGFDTETTGLKADKGDRIVEICCIKIDTDKGWEQDSKIIEQRINPRRLVSPEAMAVHGITDAELAEAPFIEDCVDELLEYLSDVETLVAHNMDFDALFLMTELERIGKPFPELEGFCTMIEGRWATGTGKVPSLQELCFTCGVDYDVDEAHAAKYDVERMLDCLRWGVEKGLYKLA